MSSPEEEEEASGRTQTPFAYVLVPIIGFGLFCVLITCYRYRRKRRLLHLQQHELEAGTGSWPRRRVRPRRLGLGIAATSMDEGLNELGEAPPAYKPPEHVAATYTQAMAAPATRRSPPGYDRVLREIWTGRGTAAEGMGRTRSIEIRQPPRAALRTSSV
ncbi:hypothetical protein GGS20DRAFT_524965 [Poronia punctata]|nr:hypothetical protein GGS20DRAFT_524965 [Poronia punctata]